MGILMAKQRKVGSGKTPLKKRTVAYSSYTFGVSYRRHRFFFLCFIKLKVVVLEILPIEECGPYATHARSCIDNISMLMIKVTA